jgi:hypothetical protein
MKRDELIRLGLLYGQNRRKTILAAPFVVLSKNFPLEYRKRCSMHLTLVSVFLYIHQVIIEICLFLGYDLKYRYTGCSIILASCSSIAIDILFLKGNLLRQAISILGVFKWSKNWRPEEYMSFGIQQAIPLQAVYLKRAFSGYSRF